MPPKDPKENPRTQRPERREDTDTRAHLERDRQLEGEIASTLKRLSLNLTAHDIRELMHRVEVSQSLESLKQELSERHRGERPDITDEAAQAILDLIRDARRTVETGLQELRIDLAGLNPTRWREIDPSTYPTSRFAWVKRLEESPLGQNIIIDLAGITVGAVDSIAAVVSLLLTIVLDIFLLPRDIMKDALQPDRTSSSEKNK